MNELKLTGYFLIIWGLASIFFDIYTRGFFNFAWIWLCTIITLLTGYAFLKKDGDLIISLFSIYLTGGVFWILDNIIFLFSKQSYFGVIEYIFEPTTPFFQVLVSMYHLFLIPFWLYGMKKMKINKGKYSQIIVLTVTLAIVSLILGNYNENNNCMFEPCLYGMDWMNIYAYRLLFPIYVIVLGCIFLFFTKRCLVDFIRKNKFIVPMAFSLAIIIFIGTIFTYFQMPHITCNVEQCKNCNVLTKCKYMYIVDDVKYGVAGIKFYTDGKKTCEIEKIINEEKQSVEVQVENNFVKEISFLVPEKDSKLNLRIDC